jgi:hypothetical protein
MDRSTVASDMAAIAATAAAVISALVALVAVIYSRAAVRAARDQAGAALAANTFARQTGQSEAIVHFVGRYHQLMEDGQQFGAPSWEYQLWGMHATEYYFFEQGWIPDFMFELWTVELTRTYQVKEARTSHQKYLDAFSDNYAGMCAFYARVREIALLVDISVKEKNKQIADLVAEWPRAAVGSLTR